VAEVVERGQMEIRFNFSKSYYKDCEPKEIFQSAKPSSIKL